MNSLRSRLILGASLIAVVPLAIAMLVLSQRVGQLVRAQAAERLGAALGGPQLQLKRDGDRIAEKLRILARDPLLKRLYLVQPAGSGDLAEYLAERRFLLGLDLLEIADTSGAVVAVGLSSADDTRPNVHEPWPLGAPGPVTAVGVAIQPLTGDSALSMVASAPIPYEDDVVGVVRGGLVFDAAFLAALARTSGVELILRDAAGRPIASTLGAGALPASPAPTGVERLDLAGHSYLSRSVPLEIGAPPYASLTGLVSTAAADRTIAALQLTSALLGVLGLALAILLGALWSSQISRPVEQLAAFSHQLAQGEWDQPLTLHSVRELQTLVAALEQMRGDLKLYRAKLVTSERQAAWGQMARKVAHEIKNPLTPIAISVADLKRSYELQRPEFPAILDQAVRTIAAEVETLKRLLQEFADFGRLPAPIPGPCLWSAMRADLEALYGREMSEGRLVLPRPDREIAFTADAGQLRQALVNLVKNALEALDGDGHVAVSAATAGESIEIVVADTGPGLSPTQRAALFQPGFTTKAHGSGLGLTIVERIVSEHHGTIGVDAAPGPGTTFRIRLPRTPRT